MALPLRSVVRGLPLALVLIAASALGQAPAVPVTKPVAPTALPADEVEGSEQRKKPRSEPASPSKKPAPPRRSAPPPGLVPPATPGVQPAVKPSVPQRVPPTVPSGRPKTPGMAVPQQQRPGGLGSAPSAAATVGGTAQPVGSPDLAVTALQAQQREQGNGCDIVATLKNVSGVAIADSAWRGDGVEILRNGQHYSRLHVADSQRRLQPPGGSVQTVVGTIGYGQQQTLTLKLVDPHGHSGEPAALQHNNVRTASLRCLQPDMTITALEAVNGQCSKVRVTLRNVGSVGLPLSFYSGQYRVTLTHSAALTSHPKHIALAYFDPGKQLRQPGSQASAVVDWELDPQQLPGTVTATFSHPGNFDFPDANRNNNQRTQTLLCTEP